MDEFEMFQIQDRMRRVGKVGKFVTEADMAALSPVVIDRAMHAAAVCRYIHTGVSSHPVEPVPTPEEDDLWNL